MRLHRFFIKDKIDPKEKVTLRYFDYDSILNQWQKVFRYIAGSRVVLFDGSGFDYLAIIEKMDSAGAVLRILETNKTVDTEEKPPNSSKVSKSVESVKSVKTAGKETFPKSEPSKVQITLLMSLIKNDNFDLVLQKATELGVSEIVPIITERTIKKDLNMARSQRILVEASEQCGRSDVPVINPIKKLGDAVSELNSVVAGVTEGGVKTGNITGKGSVGVFVCNQNSLDIKDILKKKNSYTDLIFLIGPEGGWSPKEIKLFEDSKIQFVKINQNVLRAETAAIAILSILSM
jgi:RsmE family RNA methyltransferase